MYLITYNFKILWRLSFFFCFHAYIFREFTTYFNPAKILIKCHHFPHLTLTAPSNLSRRMFPVLWKAASFLQQTLTEQDPDTPWHLQSVSIWLLRARRPASLLCRFMSPAAVPALSRASTNSLLKYSPKRRSSEHPPHSNLSSQAHALRAENWIHVCF